MTYTFKNKNTGEVFEIVMKMSEYDDYIKNNPDVERYHGDPPPLLDPVRMGIVKPPSDFQKGVVGRMMETIPNNNIRTKFGVPREW